MTQDLDEYYSHIRYINEGLAEYEDEEGNLFNLSPSNLLVAVQYKTFNKQEYEQAVFKQIIPKDIICNEVEIDKIIPKYEITKKPEDQYTLTTIKQKAKEVWLLSNGVGIHKAYTTKEEALKKAKEINKKIFEVCKIDIQ